MMFWLQVNYLKNLFCNDIGDKLTHLVFSVGVAYWLQVNSIRF